MKRLRIEILDIVQRLRQEFEGDRKLDLLGDGQRDLLSAEAVEIAQVHQTVDDKD
jgi:hypothetical protein